MATKATVLKDKDGTSLYPVTDISLVVGLQEGAIMESVVVSELPTADATTVGTIYMIPSTTVTGEFDRYMTTYSNSAYTWTQLGSTAIPSPVIADNLTTNDATQALSAKQGKVLNDNITQLGRYMSGDRAGNWNICIGPSASYSPNVSKSLAIGFQATAEKSSQNVIGSTDSVETKVFGDLVVHGTDGIDRRIVFNNDHSVTWEAVE